MPYLKLQSNGFTIYFCLDKRNTNSEWVDSSIEVTHNESQVSQSNHYGTMMSRRRY